MPKTALALASVILLAALTPAHAQATHTWVSGTGDDMNPCTITAPCKTFQNAATRTGSGGLINAFGPGGFGSVTLRRAANIVANIATASIVATSTTGITVNAGASDDVLISGLTIQGANGAAIGILVTGARTVTIRDCVIQGFQQAGISVEGAVPVHVSDCTVSGNGSGVQAKAGKLFLNRVNVAENSGPGAHADGKDAGIELNNSTVADNGGAGLDSANGGAISSFGNNAVYGNKPDGKPTEQLHPL